jgi:FAD/FMN-containing dehydrogenase
MTGVASWGRLSNEKHALRPLEHNTTSLPGRADSLGIAYGMGRSYGDVCLNPGGTLWTTTGLDRFIAWNEDTGILTCEAGLLLRDIHQLMVPRGWMLPVTPGTQLATVGGAIANDVHGKNHHMYGSFGDHVRQLHLLRTTGELLQCGPTHNPDWLAATVGGLGLTGVITQASLQMKRIPSPWLDTETIAFNALDEFFALSDASETGWEHTVAWIDCLSGAQGRGIFMRGNMGAAPPRPQPSTRRRTVPLTPPVSLVNRLSLRPFNTAYYHLHQHLAGPKQVHYESFFYPLDNLLEWNRIYGRKGFYQYQSIIPPEAGRDAVQAMLHAIAVAGEGSFLGVLKTMGERAAPGMLSFSRSGVTLALDFPNRGEPTHRLFARLDAIVREAHGRIYPAKDARMPRSLFEAGYPRLPEFLPFRDPGISSAFSRRTMGN